MNRRVVTFIVGGAVLVVSFMMVAACRSSGDLRGAGPDALAASEEEGRLAMREAAAAVDDGLGRFLALFDTFDPAPVAEAARGLYAEDAYFNDGFVELEGREAIADYLARSAGHASALDIEIEEIVRSDTGVYVRWMMRFTTSGGKAVHAPGISHLRFDVAGRILYHRDYWDASGALASMVPVVGRVLEAVRKRL